MPEPIATMWLVVLGSGGYVLAVVQFFKDFLGVRKLELELAELRDARQERERVIVRASPDEVERFGHPVGAAPRSAGPGKFMVLGVAVLGCALLLPVALDRGRTTYPVTDSHNDEADRLRNLLDDSRRREAFLVMENSRVTEQLTAASHEIESLKQALRASPSASQPASGSRDK